MNAALCFGSLLLLVCNWTLCLNWAEICCLIGSNYTVSGCQRKWEKVKENTRIWHLVLGLTCCFKFLYAMGFGRDLVFDLSLINFCLVLLCVNSHSDLKSRYCHLLLWVRSFGFSFIFFPLSCSLFCIILNYVINFVQMIIGSEKTCSKIGESEICGFTSNWTMVIMIFFFLVFAFFGISSYLFYISVDATLSCIKCCDLIRSCWNVICCNCYVRILASLYSGTVCIWNYQSQVWGCCW